jgi:CRP/FNR family transcriptional regulator, anaerobic regulatory protein
MQISSDLFKKLKSFSEPELQLEIQKHGKILKPIKEIYLVREGQYLNFLPIVVEGLLRVYQENEDREILLYYVGPEQTCMMSLSSAYFDYYSTANGIAIEPTEILVLAGPFDCRMATQISFLE